MTTTTTSVIPVTTTSTTSVIPVTTTSTTPGCYRVTSKVSELCSVCKEKLDEGDEVDKTFENCEECNKFYEPECPLPSCLTNPNYKGECCSEIFRMETELNANTDEILQNLNYIGYNTDFYIPNLLSSYSKDINNYLNFFYESDSPKFLKLQQAKEKLENQNAYLNKQIKYINNSVLTKEAKDYQIESFQFRIETNNYYLNNLEKKDFYDLLKLRIEFLNKVNSQVKIAEDNLKNLYEIENRMETKMALIQFNCFVEKTLNTLSRYTTRSPQIPQIIDFTSKRQAYSDTARKLIKISV
jgi:hypothetical protein